MMRTSAAFLAGAMIAAGVTWWIARPAPRARAPAPVATPSAAAPRIADASALAVGAEEGETVEQLRAELELERQMRDRLTEQVADLDLLVEELMAGPDAGSDAEPAGGEPAEPRDERPWFDAEGLAAYGYSPGEQRDIREVWERAVMARLELESEHVGKGRPGRRAIARGELEIELHARAELGDEGYDAMLFAGGEPNRVILTELLESSPGLRAGLGPGDEVVSYDGQRVFRPRELKRLIASGEPGELVEMRVRREGEILRLFVDRGPIGARLRLESRPPVR